MEIVTPLGGDELLFHGMQGQEEMSRPFEYCVDLLSPRHDIDMDEILGQNVSIRLALSDDRTRCFNGCVTRFSQRDCYGRYVRYFAVVRPWLWLLTRTADCRIFQDMTVPEILKAVFADHPTADFQSELTGSYRKRTYCVQYRETDFNFVSRLLEEEGISYYFRHTDGHHTLVLADSYSGHQPFPGYESLPFAAGGRLVRPDVETVGRWDFSREIQPGIYVHDDYDLERPSVELRTQKASRGSYASSDYEIYDYPGCYVQQADGEQYAAVRIDELASQYESASGATNARGLSVGHLFALEDHPRADQNREYLVRAATYDLRFSDYEALPAEDPTTDYRCAFVAMSSEQQFRPKRLTPKPFVQGPQTAVVVGPPGEEIYTDDYGRVKIQFHWDRYGKQDQNSSCWVRVSQMWAGRSWGAVSTPRIGHEVIVDFLEGDPDQPIIIGSVHNAENQPPHKGVVSGLKSNTHKGTGSSQLTMDDTAGQEKVTIHAQHDMDTAVENNQTVTVVSGNRAMTIESGTLTDVVKGDASLTVQAGSRAVDVTGGDYSATASAAVVLHGKGAGVQVTGDAAGVTVKGTGGTGVAINGTPKVEVTAAAVFASEAPVVTVNGTASCLVESPLVTIDAKSTGILKGPIIDIGDGVVTIHGSSIVLTAGGGAIEIGAAGVTINGGSVNVAGGTVNVMGGLVKIN
jgi:type VI secretion system secreted protein VgrG